MKRYRLEPLFELSGPLSMSQIRKVCPLGGEQYRQVRTVGLTEAQADRLTCSLGLLPFLVWKDWLDDAEQPCEECERPFVPVRRGHVYCTPVCGARSRDRIHKRSRYQTDPEYRARKLKASKAYNAKSARALKVKQAAYRAANRERIAAKQAEWRAANADRVKARQAAWYQENREERLAKQRVWDKARRGAA